MAELPFLVVHGTAVWIAVVAIAALAVGTWRWRRSRDIGGSVMWTIAGGGLVALTLYGAGALVMSRARLTHRTLGGHGYDGPRVAYDLGNLDALALAAALPGHRGDALEELTGRFEAYYVRDEVALERWQQIARMRGGCAGELAMLREQERIAALDERADACSDDAEAARALVFLGRYADAARRDPTNIDALIGVHQWAALIPAVVAFRDGVSHTDPQSPVNVVYPNYAGQVAPRLACAELFVRLRAGEPDAAAKLHVAVGDDPFCKILDALALPLDRQSPALLAAYPAAPDMEAKRTIELLAWAAGGTLEPHEHVFDNGVDPSNLVQLTPPGHTGMTRAMLLAPLANGVRHDPEGSPAARITSSWAAGNAILRGDLGAATATARMAAAAGGAESNDLAETAGSIVVSLALRAGTKLPEDLPSRTAQHAFLMDAAMLARGDATFARADLSLDSISCAPDLSALEIAAETAAVAGDGGPLADLIDRCGIRDGLGMRDMFGLWPRIQRGRDRIAAQLAVAGSDFGNDDPFDVLRRALLRRDVARLTGDAGGMAAWQALIDRHATALADRDALTTMIVWHLL